MHENTDKPDFEVNKLKKEITDLKKKLSAITMMGVIFGGGGIFGVYKWVDSDRKLTATEIRQNTIQTEIVKNEALNKVYSKEINELKILIDSKSTDLEELNKAKKRLLELQEQQKKSNENFIKIVPAMGSI